MRLTLEELNQAMKEVKTPEQLHNEELNRYLEEEWEEMESMKEDYSQL